MSASFPREKFHSPSQFPLPAILSFVFEGRAGQHVQMLGTFHLGKKKTEISVGAKVECPIGKKLFHLFVNPGMSRRPTVDLEMVQTTRNV